MSDTTRAEHLDWCKQRALEYCDAGDVGQAWASMTSDMGKHPATAGHTALEIGSQLLYAGQFKTPAAMRRFIEGFN